MKIRNFVKIAALTLAAAVAIPQVSSAQLGKNLLNKAKEAANNAVNGSNNSSSSANNSSSSNSNSSSSSNNSSSSLGKTTSNSSSTTGKTYYVSASGSARADGLSASTPKKDIQAVLNLIKDNKENGATIKVAEGNYLGYMNAGYIEISNWVTLEGGYNSDFSQRDPFKYITRIEPTQEQSGTNGNKALITLSKLDDGMGNGFGTLTIDGIMLNYGLENYYLPNNPSDPKNGCPSDKFETGRMVDDGAKQLSHQAIHSDAAICGNLIIRNCLIANSPYFGIQINARKGEIEIYNNVIISNRFSGVRIDGWNKNGTDSHVDFHHNTVAFSWCRDKVMEDMGYGYEFMCKVNSDVHHNIFLCNNYSALARTHVLSGPDRVIEAKRVTNLYDNIFFMNAADLQLPSAGGGKWTNVKCANFEDVDEKTLPKAEGNKELSSNDAFINVIDQDYLKGFASLKVVRSSNFDANSAANQYRQAHGLNMQGTETIRVSMYGNRYNFDKAMKFFGAKSGYGAQKK